MAWCLWFMDAEQTGFENQCGFYCNTSDSSFGPVVWIGNTTKAEIYDAWTELGLDDARRYSFDDLYSVIQSVKAHLKVE